MDPLPILREIRTDLDVTTSEQVAFWAALERLDVVEWRRLSITQLEREVERLQHRKEQRMSRSTIARAFNGLVSKGYILHQEDAGADCYRIPASRRREDRQEGPSPHGQRRSIRRTRGGLLSEAIE